MHLNHEGLFLLGAWLARRVSTPLTVHCRTIVRDTAFARWQARTLFAATRARVHITENERSLWTRLAGRSNAGLGADCVIYNSVAPSALATPHPAVPADGRFRVACLSNYAWIRGIDRLIDVAEYIAANGRRDVLFVMAGDMRLSGRLPGALGRIAAAGGTLANYAAERGVADMFQFLGHVPDPERVLAACHALAKPTRDANPWGRDILEALAVGRPVLSVGIYDRFVETDVTGNLLPVFDPGRFADAVLSLASNRTLYERMSSLARARVVKLCDPVARSRELLDVWQSAHSHAT